MKIETVVTISIIPFITFTLAIMNISISFFIAILASTLIYFTTKKNYLYKIPTLKITILGSILTLILLGESLYLINYNNQLSNQAQGFGQIMSPFASPNLLLVIVIGIIFITLPTIIFHIENLLPKKQQESI